LFHPFTHLLIYLFTHSFTHSLIHIFIHLPFTHSLTHSFTHSLIHSFTYSLTHLINLLCRGRARHVRPPWRLGRDGELRDTTGSGSVVRGGRHGRVSVRPRDAAFFLPRAESSLAGKRTYVSAYVILLCIHNCKYTQNIHKPLGGAPCNRGNH
jgi:hypothetical protein